jgi:hypothetical protein
VTRSRLAREASAPKSSLPASSRHGIPGRRLLVSRHKSAASIRPAAAPITVPALGLGFGGLKRTENMERERNAATAGAGRWEAPDGVIVLPVGSAAPQQGRQKEHQYQQRKREMEREREQQDPGAREGVLGLDPQPPEKVYYKTRLCEKFEAGKCVYEGGCTFAHGSEELRPPLPLPLLTSLVRRKSPLPSSSPGAAASSPHGGYCVRVCFEFRDTGACHRGDRCAFVHASTTGTSLCAPPPYTCAWRPDVNLPRSSSLCSSAEMPFPGGPRSMEYALRNSSSYAKAYSPGSTAAAYRNSTSTSTSNYAPATTRAFQSVSADAAGEGGCKATRLELLGRKKMNDIYGDWPEQD